jgi:hypothetical protein
MKKLLIFLAGFATAIILGHIGQWIVDRLAKKIENFNAEARELLDDYHEWTEDELLGADKLFTPDELDELTSLEDTQPIYIGTPDDEVGAWELDAWSRESG